MCDFVFQMGRRRQHVLIKILIYISIQCVVTIFRGRKIIEKKPTPMIQQRQTQRMLKQQRRKMSKQQLTQVMQY